MADAVSVIVVPKVQIVVITSVAVPDSETEQLYVPPAAIEQSSLADAASVTEGPNITTQLTESVAVADSVQSLL